MSKIRTLILIGVVVCLSAFGVAQAQAVEWAGNHYHLEPGQTGYLNHKVWVYASDVVGEGSALGCAGIVGHGPMYCEEHEHEVAGIVFAEEFWSEPYIHNHSGWGDYFKGYYY